MSVLDSRRLPRLQPCADHFAASRLPEFGCGGGRLWQRLDMAKYSAAQAKAALRFLPRWTKKGAAIMRTFQFRDFTTAIEFVKAVADLAEKAAHHPDID